VIHIDIRADVRRAQRFVDEIGERGVRKAASKAINDTLKTLRKEGAIAIRQAHPALKAGDIKREMEMSESTPATLRGYVRVTGRPFSIKLFKATQTKKGVSAKVGKGRQSLIIHHGRRAFFVQAYGDEVFVRKFGQGRQIKRFRGPSMPGIFRARTKELRKIATVRFPKAFASRIQWEIELAKRKAAAS
jgi:hypothetical protein